jgi:translation elongation factor P/translation initiation factor 5A
MKKIVVVFSLLAFVFALSSCQSGGPKADAKALIKKQEAFVKLQKDAAEDGKIDDKEIEEIVASFQSVMKDSEEIMKKYEEDSVGAEELSKEMELLAEEMEAEYSELESKVAECEGYDKLQEKMFEALFSGMGE